MKTYQTLPQVARFIEIHNAWCDIWSEYLDGKRTINSLNGPEKVLMNALDEMWAVFGITQEQRIRGF
jgi:hypothetical protein